MKDDTLLSLPSASEDVDQVVAAIRAGRTEILNDWMERVRFNRAVETDRALTDPLLLDHMPQLLDAMLDRLEVNRPRAEAEQFAAVHGFTRRLAKYDVVETVIELLMFRRAIWVYLGGTDAPVNEAYTAMQRIDGMVDRAVVVSLKSFLDPAAGMLGRQDEAERE